MNSPFSISPDWHLLWTIHTSQYHQKTDALYAQENSQKNAMFCNISGYLPGKAVGLFSEVAMYMAQADGEQRMFSEVVMYTGQADGELIMIKSKESLTFTQWSKQDRVN